MVEECLEGLSSGRPCPEPLVHGADARGSAHLQQLRREASILWARRSALEFAERAEA
jgi:hypothetical protein